MTIQPGLIALQPEQHPARFHPGDGWNGPGLTPPARKGQRISRARRKRDQLRLVAGTTGLAETFEATLAWVLCRLIFLV